MLGEGERDGLVREIGESDTFWLTTGLDCSHTPFSLVSHVVPTAPILFTSPPRLVHAPFSYRPTSSLSISRIFFSCSLSDSPPPRTHIFVPLPSHSLSHVPPPITFSPSHSQASPSRISPIPRSDTPCLVSISLTFPLSISLKRHPPSLLFHKTRLLSHTHTYSLSHTYALTHHPPTPLFPSLLLVYLSLPQMTHHYQPSL